MTFYFRWLENSIIENQLLNNLKQRAALSNSKVDFDWNAYLESLNVNFMLF